MSIIFQECNIPGYRERTIINASADVTIAFAVDFTTPGEILTKSAVLKQGKKYIAIDANDLVVTQKRIDKLISALNSIVSKATGTHTTNDVNHKMDGYSHINIYSNAKTHLGRMLSNFAETPLTIGKNTFASVESWWYWIKAKNINELSLIPVFDAKQIEKIKKLPGNAAKIFFRKHFNDKHSEYNPTPKQVKEIFKLKLEQHPHIKKALYESTLPFAHYYFMFDKKINADKYLWVADLWRELREEIQPKISNEITVNIAGNGIYTLHKIGSNITQIQIDEFVYEMLKLTVESPDLKVKIKLIRSGGQTGFDEAGIKAALKLKIPALVFAPKGWAFRPISNTNVLDEELFKKRFIINEL